MYMINCILPVLPPSHICPTPKKHRFCLYDSSPKLCLIVSSMGTFKYNLAHWLCNLLSPLVADDYSCKDTFSLVFQIKNANLSSKFLVFYIAISVSTNIPLQETIVMAINPSFNHNPNLNIFKKELKKFSFLPYHRLIFFLILKLVLHGFFLWLLSLPIFSRVFWNLIG